MNETASGISGIVADALTNQPIPFAKVIVAVNGVRKGGATTDMNGKFIIRLTGPGLYNLEAGFTGYQPSELKDIDVLPYKVTEVRVPMTAANAA